ncbi:hypothetical protein GCM10017687_01630 [Streptomyces echinatus]
MPSPQQARAQASAITSGKTVPATEAAPTSRLRELFDGPRLSPGQRRIAQYLIEHITEAAFLSITELADRVGVSQPSVTRFAAAVGFSGYPALREKLQSIALSSLAGGPGEEDRANELQAAIDGEIQNLENLRRDFADPDRVIRVGRELSRSTPADRPGPAHLGVAGRVLRLRRPPYPPGRAAGDPRRAAWPTMRSCRPARPAAAGCWPSPCPGTPRRR